MIELEKDTPIGITTACHNFSIKNLRIINTKRLIDESKFVLSTSVIDTQKIVWNSHNLLD